MPEPKTKLLVSSAGAVQPCIQGTKGANVDLRTCLGTAGLASLAN